ncbi:MAG: hypothetical protein JKY95_05040 [Planctomycetaceae bacterium]|nr:hypothetical protein [Planctomycetaceae bacterium]
MTRDGVESIAQKPKDISHLRNIQAKQGQIRHTPKIQEIIGDYVIMEKATGELIWEIGKDFPHLKTSLMEFVDDLKSIGLVHADLRPWNIFYDEHLIKYHIIDWSHSFFREGPKPSGFNPDHLLYCNHANDAEQDIDALDVKSNLELINGTTGLKKAWHYGSGTFRWQPDWCSK